MMTSVVMLKDSAASRFYLPPKPLELFTLLVKRPVASRDAIWTELWAGLPDADQPNDDKIIDQMLVHLRRQCRAEGIDIQTLAQGFAIPAEQKERAHRLLEMALITPKRRGGPRPGAGYPGKYTPERIAISGHAEPQPSKNGTRKPNMDLLSQDFVIESDVPIPMTHGHYAIMFEKFRSMKPGDSFKAMGPYEETRKTIYNASQHFRYKCEGGKEYWFKIAPIIGGVRIWRLKEPTYRHNNTHAKDSKTGAFIGRKKRHAHHD